MSQNKFEANNKQIVTNDPWSDLKTFTNARIALGRCGVAPPLNAILDFKHSHAQARDAIHCNFEKDTLIRELEQFHSVYSLKSEIKDRQEYLTRPDLGKKLSKESESFVKSRTGNSEYDVCFIIGDGLSSIAIHENAVPFLKSIYPHLIKCGLSVAPFYIVENARVAVADKIGDLTRSKISIILIGERPGLSSPDSMGAYLTHSPKEGKTDESRNCISNIRADGLPVINAVQKLTYLIERSLKENRSGVELKDKMPNNYLPFQEMLQIEG